MSRVLITILFLLGFTSTQAQLKYAKSEANEKLYADVRVYLAKNDVRNAINVLKGLTVSEPENFYFKRDLAAAYLSLSKVRSAEMVIEDCLKIENANEDCYMLGATIYSKLDNFKAAKKVVNKGLEKYSSSAVLWNAKGELNYNFNKMDEAIKAWEQGAVRNPNYSQLFYNLANYYSTIEKNPIKASVHAEMFLNMESYTPQSIAMKKVVFEAYKELIKRMFESEEETESKIDKEVKPQSDFEDYLLSKLKQNRIMVMNGYNFSDLLNWRSQFLKDIMNDNKFDYSLFDQYRKISGKNHWESYNRWIFESVDDATAYTAWVKNNGTSHDEFLKYLQEEKVKPKPEEFYFNLN